ncbi:MAG: hypothetical protein SGJ11_12320 [Phycisphaerae bacterium]|nr:hypothetical protein [Phycisphaerae bacterium]
MYFFSFATRRPALGLVVVSFAVALPLIGSNSVPQPSPADVVRTLRDAESMELVATVELRSVDPSQNHCLAADGDPIGGGYAYRSLGAAWRATSWMDPNRHFALDTEVSYDGTAHSVYMNNLTGRAAIRSQGEPVDGGFSLAHPLFRLAAWAAPLDDTSAGAFKQSELAAIAENAMAIDDAAWSEVTIDGVAYDVTVVPGAQLNGAPYTHRITTPQGLRNEPFRIEYVRSNGIPFVRLQFENWSPPDSDPASTVRFPRLVQFQSLDPTDGAVLVNTTYTITHLKINTPVSYSTVPVDTNEALHLYHDDLGIELW